MKKIKTTKNEKGCWINGEGDAIPPKLIRPEDKKRETLLQRSGNRMIALQDTIVKVKAAVEKIVDAYIETLALPADWKGNMEIISYDGKVKLQVKSNPVLEFSESIHTAKARLDLLLEKWAAGSRDEIKLLVQRAFVTNRKGQMDKRAILGLRTLNIKDPEWQAIMELISDSVKVINRKRYIMLLVRNEKDEWENINLNWANA